MTLWSGRFDTAPDPAAFDFGISFGFDRHCSKTTSPAASPGRRRWRPPACSRREDADGIVGALRDILDDGRANPSFVAGPDEDVHSFVERQLIERVGDAGRRLHTGRSRNEQVSLDLRLYLRRRIPLLQQALVQTGRRVRRSGRRRRRRADAVVHAPAPRAAGARRAFLSVARGGVAARRRQAGGCRRRSRCADARLGRNRRHQLSGGHRVCSRARSASRASCSTAWTPRPIAISSRRSCMRVAVAMVHLSRMAEDLIIFTGEEHGFFELSDASATGSSMMPQKKNPDPLELVRGKTGRAIGRLTGWLATHEGAAERLQQGPAGGQGGGVRRGTDAGGLVVGDARGRLAAVGERGADGARRRACCWPPTSPITWYRAACRSAARTKSSARWCVGCSPKGAISAI